MKRLITLITVTATLAACSEPTAPTRAAPTHAPATNLLQDLLHRARITLTTPSSAVTQTSASTWLLTKVGALDAATSNVTWTITATQNAAGAKKLVVAGKITLKNTGTKAAPIGNVVVALQHKPALQWVALASDVATATAGDAATSAKIVKWTNNSDDSDGVDDDDSVPGDSWNVTTMDENPASGPLAFTSGSPAATLAPGAAVTLSFMASYDNTALNLPVGRKVRAQIYVTFGNAGLGLTTAANLDIDGNGTIDADEARVRTVTARLGEKVVPAPTAVSTPVTLSDAVADITTTGTVTYTNPVFTLGATTGTVTAHVAGGASGGTIANCAHLTGTGINLQACNTQQVPAASPAPGAWKNGDFITYSQESWGNPTHAAGQTLTGNYDNVFGSTSGLFEVGIPGSGGFSMVFTQASAVLAYLPASGFAGSLAGDIGDPTSTASGAFGGDITTLALNVVFSDAGVTLGASGVRFGDLRVCGLTSPYPDVNGKTVREVLEIGRTLLGGGSAALLSVDDLQVMATLLGLSFESGVVTPFARDHLVIGSCPNTPPAFAWKNGDVITYSQEEWGNPTHAAGQLLLASFGAVYAPTLVLEVGILGTSGASILFTDSFAVVDFLPGVGSSASLIHDLLNPTTSPAGLFGGTVVGLRLNVDFSDAGLLPGTAGVRFGDLTMCGFTTLPGLNGMSVRGFLTLTSTLLGGGTGVHSIAELDGVLYELDPAFEGGVVRQFARDHLVIGSCR